MCRVSKIFPAGEHSYTSVIELKNTSFSEVINHILKDSYQIECEVKISQDSDQSILIMKLPSMAYDKEKTENLTLVDYWKKNEVNINGLLKKGINKYDEVQKSFESLGLIFVAAKEVKYFCPCSKDRMIQSIRGLSPETTEDLFSLEGKELETKCDYCKKVYHINKAEILS